jgi:hypothetical protein
MSYEVRASGRSAGPLVITAGTWQGEPDELWSSITGGVLGRRLLAPRGQDVETGGWLHSGAGPPGRT